MKRNIKSSHIDFDGEKIINIKQFSRRNPFYIVRTHSCLKLLNLHNKEIIPFLNDVGDYYYDNLESYIILPDKKAICFIKSTKEEGTFLGTFNCGSILD